MEEENKKPDVGGLIAGITTERRVIKRRGWDSKSLLAPNRARSDVQGGQWHESPSLPPWGVMAAKKEQPSSGFGHSPSKAVNGEEVKRGCPRKMRGDRGKRGDDHFRVPLADRDR